MLPSGSLPGVNLVYLTFLICQLLFLVPIGMNETLWDLDLET